MTARGAALCLLGLTFAAGAQAVPSAVEQLEIEHLIEAIGSSGCAFKRNDAWNDAPAAEAHLRHKFTMMKRLGLIETTADFIEKTATQSYLSKRPYEIKCGGETALPSRVWLLAELARYRTTRAAAAAAGSQH